jgi:cellulose synthase/poly-beta-1,6-N-acetylglucosamine synthase-like glycosyltransferase
VKWVFWISCATIAYAYLGYAIWLRFRAWIRPWPVLRGPFSPTVSIVMVVRDEEDVIDAKLANLQSLEYPADRIEFVMVSDGSTDATGTILEHFGDKRLRFRLNPERHGKAASLNDAIAMATGEIVVFTDARQRIEPGALRLLAENFADPAVGCVSGELMLGDSEARESVEGMGLYWKIEKKIRESESSSGSVVGATGALYAARRDLVGPLPAGTILDDVLIPMSVVRSGARVVFDNRARAWDRPNLGGQREFRRKVRTLGGNYQLVQLAPWLLSNQNPVRFEFVSHKLLRLLVPFALVAAWVSSFFIPGTFYRAAFWLQTVFYGLSVLALTDIKLGFLQRLADPAKTLVVLNAAAAVAFLNFAMGRKVAWSR